MFYSTRIQCVVIGTALPPSKLHLFIDFYLYKWFAINTDMYTDESFYASPTPRSEICCWRCHKVWQLYFGRFLPWWVWLGVDWWTWCPLAHLHPPEWFWVSSSACSDIKTSSISSSVASWVPRLCHTRVNPLTWWRNNPLTIVHKCPDAEWVTQDAGTRNSPAQEARLAHIARKEKKEPSASKHSSNDVRKDRGNPPLFPGTRDVSKGHWIDAAKGDARRRCMKEVCACLA